jgi:hypothetical protein
MENTIAPGTEGLIKHTSAHSSATRYQAVKVTRTTKARVFARATYEGAPELEFRLDNLHKYGDKSWRADELIVDPAAIAKIGEQQEAARVRGALEGKASIAMADLRKLFEGYSLRNRSEAEIAALVDLRNRLCMEIQPTG